MARVAHPAKRHRDRCIRDKADTKVNGHLRGAGQALVLVHDRWHAKSQADADAAQHHFREAVPVQRKRAVTNLVEDHTGQTKERAGDADADERVDDDLFDVVFHKFLLDADGLFERGQIFARNVVLLLVFELEQQRAAKRQLDVVDKPDVDEGRFRDADHRVAELLFEFVQPFFGHVFFGGGVEKHGSVFHPRHVQIFGAQEDDTVFLHGGDGRLACGQGVDELFNIGCQGTGVDRDIWGGDFRVELDLYFHVIPPWF